MPESDDFPDPRPAGPDRRDNVASAGLDPDTWDELESWRVENRLKRSEAVRQVIRDGLDEQNPDGWYNRIGRTAMLLLLAGYPTGAALGGRPDTALLWLAIVTIGSLFEPWITAGISRIPNPVQFLK